MYTLPHTAPEDYVGSTQTLTFSSTVSQLSASVTTTQDSVVEADEIFFGVLTSANSDDAFLTPDLATATISGDEPNDCE